jgi:(p)ppGpp synthase/HD superfamily hydrolase
VNARVEHIGEDVPHLTFLGHLPLSQQALEFAVKAHAGQQRAGDQARFVAHPTDVAAMLDRARYPDEVIAAAVLHDVLENTTENREELEARFGPEVAELVATVSDDESIEDENERKADLRDRVRTAGGYAAAVYAADKVAKVREIRIGLVAGTPWSELKAKYARHRESLAMLEQTIPESRLVELLRYEIEALSELPPAP